MQVQSSLAQGEAPCVTYTFYDTIGTPHKYRAKATSSIPHGAANITVTALDTPPPTTTTEVAEVPSQVFSKESGLTISVCGTFLPAHKHITYMQQQSANVG